MLAEGVRELAPEVLSIMRYDAILFDLDNTLYDYDAYWYERLLWALEPVVVSYPRLDAAMLARQAMEQRIYAREWEGFLRDVGVESGKALAVALQRYRANYYNRLRMYDHAIEALNALWGCWKLGLITNGPSWSQRPKIEQFALDTWMDVIVVSEEVGLAKPDPAIFHLALRQIAIPPERALFVGDSLEHDMHGAYAAGLDFAWMNPKGRALPSHEPPPVAIIIDLRELLDCVLPDR